MWASYNGADYIDTTASFDYPVPEVGSALSATIGKAAAPLASPANLLCAQTSSSTGTFILSGVPGSAVKGGSLNIEAISGDVDANGNLVVKANPVVSVQFSISSYVRLPILQWLAKETRESLSCLSQVQLNITTNNIQTIFNYVEPAQIAAGTGVALNSLQLDPAFYTSAAITLSLRYISPPPNYSQKDVVRSYYQVDRYITTFNSAIAPITSAAYANSGTQISSTSFTLNFRGIKSHVKSVMA